MRSTLGGHRDSPQANMKIGAEAGINPDQEETRCYD
jgi:hypothetical protein